MKALVAYRTRYGTTAACARKLAGQLRAETTCVDLAQGRAPDVHGFDVVLIGGSIYGGKIQREVSWFCERNRDALLEGKVGLFLCCLYQGARAEAQLQDAFPPWLAARAFDGRVLGGELHMARLRLFDRLLVRSLPHPSGDVSRVHAREIEALAAAANAFLKGP
ncbi:MAG: flavodoxin domain-containing protein [Spirochaetia bacterium]|jgi:menaquinone-dependent protoporphyrinogen oxidase